MRENELHRERDRVFFSFFMSSKWWLCERWVERVSRAGGGFVVTPPPFSFR
jgi:hypothetical protein